MNSKTVATAIGLAIFASAISFAGTIPLGPRQFEFLYEQIEYQSSFRPDKLDYQIGPCTIEKLNTSAGPLQALVSPGVNRITSYLSLEESLAAQQTSRFKATERLRGGFSAAPHERVFLFANFSLDEQKADDPDYYGKKWRGLAGSVENAFVTYDAGKFQATVGRFASFWGGYRSLLFSPDLPLDGFACSYRWGFLVLSYRLAELSSLYAAENSDEAINRYLAAHRLDLHLTSRLRLAIFETVLFGGVGRQVEFAYLNPVISFHAAQMNEGVDDNIIIGFDGDYKLAPGKKLYGQLLIDDYQIDNGGPGDNEPNQYALLAGIFYGNIIPQIDIRLEYTRVTNWTFNQHQPRNRYLEHSTPIGNLSGNDFDKTSLSISRWLCPDFNIGVETAFRRQGEGRIENDWTSPWFLALADYNEKFPSGVVENQLSVAVDVRGYLSRFLFLNGQAGWRSIQNIGNRPGADQGSPFVNIVLSSTADFGFSVD